MTMSGAGFLVLFLVLLVACSEAEPATEVAEASDGGQASLPCSLTAAQAQDRVSVVLWYRGGQESPVYKLDFRGPRPQHWADPGLGDRYFLQVLDEDRAVLKISPTRMDDEEVYHCRVDFYKSPTKITHVNLTIVVPPTGVQVTDGLATVKNGITTAYAEGASLTLTCTATGGKPQPRVSWWRDQVLATDDTQYFPERRKSQSVLKIDKLTRSHLLAVYSCEVSNSRLQPPLIVRVAVDMYLRPLEVSLVGDNPEFSAGTRYNITCSSRGSRPPSTITWWKDGVSLDGGSVTHVSDDGNVTTSSLAFIPTSADHGLILTCKASNQRIPYSEQQRTWMLRVNYPPKVTLNLGTGLDPNGINVGSDVYFECHLTANPWVHRVWWLRDGNRLFSNATAGVIVSNQTLVLQSVSRASSGRYSCEATNKEGTSRSPSFHLKVKFSALCSERGRKVLGAAKDEPLLVLCKVDAEPPASLFRWTFNSTPGIARELTEFSSNDSYSTLSYVARSAADYGTLQCWGRNEAFAEITPCTYHIVPAGKPDPPHTCGVTNVTHHSVLFACQKGFDGGMKQKFTLLLRSGEEVIANISSAVAPDFNVSNLSPAQEYSATVFSVNSKGSAKSITSVQFRTLPAPGLKEQRRSTGPSDGDKSGTGPWLYILLAAGSTLIVASAIGIIIFTIRRFRVDSPVRERRPRSPNKRDETPLNPRAQPPYTDPITDDNNPDLIPPANESLLDASMVPYTITARPSTKRNCATQMPVKPYHVTWAPILQSRNCSTQTPPPHKESSV